MQFEFATAGRILFGPGRLKEIGVLAGAFGRRALIVSGAHPERAEELQRLLGEAGISSRSLSIEHEPTTDDLRRGERRARADACDLILGFGGGSAMDAAKGIAAVLGNGGDPLDYLELLPAAALVDPELTVTMPSAVTASTGLDALTQLIEPFVSARASPVTDALCRDGLQRVARSLRRACEEGDDRGARQDMSLAALFSGLAMANAGLGSVHGFAGVIGGTVTAPHGAVCAALLPHAIRVNVRAFLERAPGDQALEKFREVGQLLTGKASAGPDEAVRWIADLCAALRVPPLTAYGLKPSQLSRVVEKSAVSSSMKANPITLTSEEMQEIVRAAM
jgi:alcohol dehydrogenase class IV